jgi:glycosyltransferase involved in cell wall biosynthesis
MTVGAGEYDLLFYMRSVATLLARDDGLPAGGAEMQALLVSQALAQSGLRVCLCGYEAPGADVPDVVGGVDVVLRPPFMGGTVRARLREPLGVRAALAAVPARAVVTRAAGPEVGLVATAARSLARPFVYSTASYLDFSYGDRVRSRRDRFLFAAGLRLADAIVVQTEEQRALCREALGRDGVLIPSVAVPVEPGPQDPTSFLWLGRIHPVKQPLLFVELARRLPAARFTMVAVPERQNARLEQKLRAAAAGTPNLELLPPRPRAAVGELLDRAVAVVSTSVREGMPNTFLEGWARGVPALAIGHDPDRVIERHRIGGAGDGTVETLAALARSVARERANGVELSRRCREYVAEHHAPTAVASAWAELLVRLGESRRGRYMRSRTQTTRAL